MIEECLAVEFEVRDDGCPLADAAEAGDIRIDAKTPQMREDGYTLLQFTAPKSEQLRTFLDQDERIRYLHITAGTDNDTYRCLSKHPCVVHELVSSGFMIQSLQYQDGRAVFFGTVIGREVLKNVMKQAGDTVGVQLRRAYPLDGNADTSPSRQWDITVAQEECIDAALEMGYFSIPRESTASDVADRLGISKSAFLQRLHRAERTLFRQIFI